MNTQQGNYLENFSPGQIYNNAIPRTITEGDTKLYLALIGNRNQLHCSLKTAQAVNFKSIPIDDLLLFHIAFGRTVNDISLNAVANLGYANIQFKNPAYVGDTITSRSKIIGLEENSNKYFITDILYFNSSITTSFRAKIDMLKEIEEAFFITENSVVFPEYESNIIRCSKELLQESRDVILVFIPDTDYQKLKIWTPITLEPEITLQVIRRARTNYFTLGYDNEPIDGFNIPFNSIFIQKAFIDSNNIKINDYILFKFDYNLQTGLLSSRILTPLEKTNRPNMSHRDTLIKLSLILFFLLSNNNLIPEFLILIIFFKILGFVILV